MGKNQKPSQQREPCGQCLLQDNQSKDPIDKAFLLQLQEALCLQGLVLLGELNHLNI